MELDLMASLALAEELCQREIGSIREAAEWAELDREWGIFDSEQLAVAELDHELWAR